MIVIISKVPSDQLRGLFSFFDFGALRSENPQRRHSKSDGKLERPQFLHFIEFISGVARERLGANGEPEVATKIEPFRTDRCQ